MATPVKTLIINNLISAIDAIAAGATYSRTVQTCTRQAQPLTEAAARGDTVSITACRERKRALTGGVNKREVTMTLTLLCDVSDQADQCGALDKLQADIEKAISVDTTRGGKAISTDVVSTDDALAEPPRPLGSCLMEIEIKYRHAAGDPYTAA